MGINNFIVEGLVDIGTLMSMLATTMIRALRILHLVFKSKSYKTTSNVMIQTMEKIERLSIKIGSMVFMVVDTDNYDVLLKLHLGMEKERKNLQLDWQAWVNGLIKFRSTTYPMLIIR
jgi:hypothetical protein